MNERYEYLLDQYFSRRITPGEQSELDQLKATDPDFADMFAFQRKAAAAVIRHERDQFKATLQQEEAQYNKGGSNGWSVWTKYSMAAAAVVAVVLIARYFIPGTTTAAPMAFVPYPNEFAVAGTSDDTSPLKQASNAYQAGDYAAAAAQFAATDPSVEAHRFYQGVAQAGAGQYAEAIATLQPVANNTSSEYAPPALYYIAWSYFKTNNKPAAKTAATAYLATPKKKGDDTFRKNAAEIGK